MTDPSSQDSKGEEKAVLITADMLAPESPNSRIDLERGMPRFPPFTCGMIGILFLIYFWELSSGALNSAQALINAGALYHDAIVHGQIWRLLTAIFLHASFDHVFGNCLALYIAGIACEHIYGTRQVLGAYLLAGLCGSILSTAFHPGPGVGASGAIFGLVGLLVHFLWVHEEYFAARNKQIYVMLGIWAAYMIWVGFMNPVVDNLAHIGGAVGGIIGVYIWRPRILDRMKDPIHYFNQRSG